MFSMSVAKLEKKENSKKISGLLIGNPVINLLGILGVMMRG